MQSYEELVTAGIDAREQKDTAQWALGDLVLKVAGGGTVAVSSYAGDIGLSARTAQEYQQMAAFYPPDTRAEFENLTYSHYRDAARAGRWQRDKALSFLEVASSEGFSVGRFREWLAEQRETGAIIKEQRALLEEAYKVLCELAPNHELLQKLGAHFGDYRAARGAGADGDNEPAEVSIRRLRDGGTS